MAAVSAGGSGIKIVQADFINAKEYIDGYDPCSGLDCLTLGIDKLIETLNGFSHEKLNTIIQNLENNKKAFSKISTIIPQFKHTCITSNIDLISWMDNETELDDTLKEELIIALRNAEGDFQKLQDDYNSYNTKANMSYFNYWRYLIGNTLRDGFNPDDYYESYHNFIRRNSELRDLKAGEMDTYKKAFKNYYNGDFEYVRSIIKKLDDLPGKVNSAASAIEGSVTDLFSSSTSSSSNTVSL